MNSFLSSQSAVEGTVEVAILPRYTGFHRAVPTVESLPYSVQRDPKGTGYGLPCVKCKTYFTADLSACPVCKTEDLISPASVMYNNTSSRPSEPVAPERENVALKEERDRFLRKFWTKALNVNGQVD